MLFDDKGLAECERMFEEDTEASGGLGALRASGEGELAFILHVQSTIFKSLVRYDSSYDSLGTASASTRSRDTV